MTFGVLLVVAAASLFSYNQWDENRAFGSGQELAAAFNSQVPKQAAPQPAPEVPGASYPDVTGQPAADATAAADNTAVTDENAALANKKFVMIDGNAYIGMISIPDLNIQLPVMAVWSNPNMKLAPCRYFGSLASNNMVILAHDYKRFFGNISTLAQGSPVIFTDADGVDHPFAVAEVTTLAPTAIAEMTGSDYPLTLFTCTYSGTARVTVRCVAADQQTAFVDNN